MLNKNYVILLLSLLIGQFANAQVSGNIQLVDIYGNLLTDHSGTMVVFEPKSGGAVQDTVYTDVNGDFSATLISGQYRAVYENPGYGTKWFPKSQSPSGWIQTPNYSLPHDTLGKLLPVVPITGIASGNLLPFTHYAVYDSLIIPFGDTLTLQEGTWLSVDEFSKIIAYGHLELAGIDTAPAALLGIYPDYAGYSVGISISNIGGFLKLESGASITGNNSVIMGLAIDAFRSDISLSKSTSAGRDRWTVLNRSGGNTNFLDHFYLNITLDESKLTLQESDMGMILEAKVASTVNAVCSYLDGLFEVTSNSIFRLKDSGLAGGQNNDFNGTDSLIFNNSIVSGGEMYFRNTLSSDTTYVLLENSTLVSVDMRISDNVYLYAHNNVGLRFISGPNPADARIVAAEYNHITQWQPSSGNTIFLPVGLMYPSDMIVFAPANVDFDSIDVYNNVYENYRYFQNLNLNWQISGIKTDTSFVDSGDPNILDPDGSRSNKGARYNGCSNSFLSFQPDTTTPTPIDSVYPGDANYDGTADNFDLLPIGYLWGETGPVRAGASLAWVGQYTDPWTAALPNGRNAKHTDCDGNGTVDYDDVAAIYQNYGLTHTVQKQPFGDGLWLQFPSDSIFEGDTVEIKVMLGTTTQPVTGIAGLAFSITYDPAFVKPGSARMAFDSSWLGTDSVDLVTFHREDTMAFRNDIALSRTDRVQLSGSGHIGTLIVVINDDILAKDSMTLTTFMDFGGIGAKNAAYGDISVGGNAGTVNVQVGYDRISSTVNNNLEAVNIKVYPNPAQDKLQIVLPSGSNGSIDLYTVEGKKVASTQAQENNTLTLDNLDNGLYILRIQIGKEMLTYKISVRH